MNEQEQANAIQSALARLNEISKIMREPYNDFVNYAVLVEEENNLHVFLSASGLPYTLDSKSRYYRFVEE
jgi:predicted nucleotide-binding protein (sugar kinase/HSP70/actin superfamily)